MMRSSKLWLKSEDSAKVVHDPNRCSGGLRDHHIWPTIGPQLIKALLIKPPNSFRRGCDCVLRGGFDGSIVEFAVADGLIVDVAGSHAFEIGF
jgi:hypothetical protein